MPDSVRYQVVSSVEGSLDVLELSAEQLYAALEVRGHAYVRLNSNPRQRSELQGQPVFDGLNGPMYGGPGVVRYETAEAYRRLSA